MREFDLPCLLIQLKHREVYNPAEFKQIIINQILILTDFHTGTTRKAGRLRCWRASKESRIAILQAKTLFNLFCLFRANGLGNRTAGLTLAIDDIAHAGRAFALCPAIHPVCYRPAATIWPRYSAHNRALFNILGKNRKS